MIWSVALLTCLLVAGGFGYWLSSGARKQAILFREDTLRNLTYSARLNSDQAEAYAQLLRMIASDDPDHRAELDAEVLRYRAQIDEILRNYSTAIHAREPEAQRLFQDFVAKRKATREVTQRIRHLLSTGEIRAARKLGDDELPAAYRAYSLAGDKLYDYEVSVGTQRAHDIERASINTQILTACICIVLFLAGLFSPLVLAFFLIGEQPV